MRKLMLTVLLATSVAVPAMARPHERFGDQPNAEPAQEQEQQRERPQRAEREQSRAAERANWSDRGAERQRAVEQQQPAPPQVVQQEQRSERPAWAQQRGEGNRGFGDGQRNWSGYGQRGQVQVEQRQVQQQQQVQQQIQQREEWRNRRDDDQRRAQGYAGQGFTQQRYVQQNDGRRYEGQRNWTRDQAQSGATRQWSEQWRRDRNYDWRSYRDRNRSLFRVGQYYDPYRSTYRRFSIGFNLYPDYYQSNYWLDDPWMYHLPPAYGPYRWVRYYDDALLVNIYTGQVVDVIYSVFW